MAEKQPLLVGVWTCNQLLFMNREDVALIMTLIHIVSKDGLAALHVYVITLTGHQRAVGLDFYQYAQVKMFLLSYHYD